MGVMDRFLNAMRLNSDEDDYYDDDFYDEEDEDVDEEGDEEEDYEPRRRNPFRGRRGRDDYYDDEDDDEDDDYIPARSGSTSARSTSSSQGGFSKVTQMRPSRRSSGGSSSGSMEVCVIKPISVDDSREITETLLSNRTVILNLEGMDIDIAQRIIDFTSGSCYAIGGSLQKVSNYIFVVTPSNVDISGDIQDIMSAFGSPAGIQTDI